MQHILDKISVHLQQAAITAIIVVIGLLVIKHNQAPTLVKIDLVAITTHYTEIMTKETLGDSSPNNPAVKRISDTIKANLEPLIANYAKNNKVIVIQAQALVDGVVPDITNTIIAELDAKLK